MAQTQSELTGTRESVNRDKNLHDNAVKPVNQKTASRFYTESQVVGMTRDDSISAATFHRTLIDGGSTSNCIPAHIVELMCWRKARIHAEVLKR
ncbi:hypothetical protein N7486_001838 [Penicillium sp. IBT 16267x]|nr:hypothetical protein N7486_001838 [Penicillium sp. IBT 16267x]